MVVAELEQQRLDEKLSLNALQKKVKNLREEAAQARRLMGAVILPEVSYVASIINITDSVILLSRSSLVQSIHPTLPRQTHTLRRENAGLRLTGESQLKDNDKVGSDLLLTLVQLHCLSSRSNSFSFVH
jgi:hypothetical protein